MNWIYFATLSGGVLVVVSVIGAITRGGGGWARALLLMVLIGCLMAGALVFTGFRPAGRSHPHVAPVPPSVRIAVAPPVVDAPLPTTHLRELELDRRGRGRTSGEPYPGPHADAAFPEGRVFETTLGERVAIAQVSPKAVKEGRRRETRPVEMAVAALAVIAFLYVAYLFLDAGTRGQFTWLLRITSIVAFAVICIVVAMVRQRM